MVSATMMLGAVFFTHGTGDVDLDIKLRWSSGQTSRKKLLLLHISYPRVIKHSSSFIYFQHALFNHHLCHCFPCQTVQSVGSRFFDAPATFILTGLFQLVKLCSMSEADTKERYQPRAQASRSRPETTRCLEKEPLIVDICRLCFCLGKFWKLLKVTKIQIYEHVTSIIVSIGSD